MGYIDQFIASVTFNTDKVIEFREQSVWKTIVYVLVFVIVTGIIHALLRWEYSFESIMNNMEGAAVGLSYDSMRIAHAFMRYALILVDLIIHFILISAIAYAGSRGYRTIGDVVYREIWNVTAYGISAPILVRLVVQTMGWELQIMTLAYWGAITIFSMMCTKKIVNLPK